MKRQMIYVLMVLMTPMLASGADLEVVSAVDGTPTFIRGELGFIAPMPSSNTHSTGLRNTQSEARVMSSAKTLLQDLVIEKFDADGNEDLVATRLRQDDLGTLHVRFDQYIDGLKVIGANLVLHSDAATGAVYAVNGNFVSAKKAPSRDAERMASQSIMLAPAVARAHADVVESRGGIHAAADGGSEVHGVRRRPAATPLRHRGPGRHRGVVRGVALVGVWRPPVCRPFPEIARHAHHAEGARIGQTVGGERTILLTSIVWRVVLKVEATVRVGVGTRHGVAPGPASAIRPACCPRPLRFGGEAPADEGTEARCGFPVDAVDGHLSLVNRLVVVLGVRRVGGKAKALSDG